MRQLRPTAVAEHTACKVHRQIPTFTDPTPHTTNLPDTFMVNVYVRGEDPNQTRIRKGYRQTKTSQVEELHKEVYSHYTRTIDAGEAAYTSDQMVLKLNEYTPPPSHLTCLLLPLPLSRCSNSSG